MANKKKKKGTKQLTINEETLDEEEETEENRNT